MKKDQGRVTLTENNRINNKWNNSAYFLKESSKIKV